jgi:hypothetical protein
MNLLDNIIISLHYIVFHNNNIILDQHFYNISNELNGHMINLHTI